MYYLVEASCIDEMLLELGDRLYELEGELVARRHSAAELTMVYKCHGMLRVLREEIRAQIHDPAVAHAPVEQTEGSDRT